MADINKKTLALVLRVSRVGKREGERFQSPGDQIAIGTARAEREGYEVQVFDADTKGQGVSGATPFDKRPGMGEALAFVEEGKLAGVVVAALDRLVREDPENGVTLRAFQQRIRAARSVLLVADNAQAEVLDPDDDELEGNEEWGVEAQNVANKLLRREARKKWRRAKHNAWKRGVFVGSAPAGFRRNADGTLAKSEHVVQVEAALRLAAKGGSAAQAARALGGVPTSRGSTVWSGRAASKLLTNPIYKGVFACSCGRCGEFVVREDLRVVPDSVWNAAQPMTLPRDDEGKVIRTGQATKKDRGSALLAGVLKCGTCGHVLTRSFTTRNGKRYDFYTCKRDPRCTAPASASALKVEPLIVRDFLSAVAYSHVAPAPPDLTPLERVVEDAREVEEAWKVKALAGESPDIAIPAFEAAKERRKAAEKALDEAREAAGLNDERLTMAEQWADMTVEDQNRTMLRFGATAIVTRSKSPVEDRVLLTFTTDDYRNAATSDDFQPDVVVEAEVAA
jgi:DNA invertase Pin-like site-specific DNA recombinase